VRTWILLLAFAASLVAVPSSHADSLSVYVGYTDSEHKPTSSRIYTFPTIPCTTFGPTCQVQQGVALDGGVFEISNPGSTPVEIADITVILNPTADPIVFSLWTDVTIPAGGAAFFGQTSQWDFDTSDFPLVNSLLGFRLNGIGGCTTLSALTAAQQAECKANFPIISFDVDGNPVAIIDSGSILNTGSYDLHYSPVGIGNESIGWALAGTVQTGAVPEPGSAGLLAASFLALIGLRLGAHGKKVNSI